MSPADLADIGSGALRVRRWRDDRASVIVVPVHDGASIPPRVIAATVAQLSLHGVRDIYTPALAPSDHGPFRDSGFEVFEHLHLLAHDLSSVPTASHPARLRRGKKRERNDLLRLDNAAFEGFWRLDAAGFADALAATPITRLRVAVGEGGAPPRGYAIVGRAAERGYLQRIAVHPDSQGQGIGRALVVDGLHWLKRRNVRQALVNTQENNERALGLYRALGFSDQHHGLDVLRLRISTAS